MKAYFDASSPELAILVIEPETDEEKAMLSLWHRFNIAEQAVYHEIVNSGTLGSLHLELATLCDGKD